MKKFGYGAIFAQTGNIGDMIQTIAASNLLPSIDYYINRDNMYEIYDAKTFRILDKNEFDNIKIAVIMNAWWMNPISRENRNYMFDPPDFLIPLCISMHIIPALFNSPFFETLLGPFLKKYEPIGCRDLATYNFVIKKNIKAYISGCMTLTLVNNTDVKSDKKYCATRTKITDMEHINHDTSYIARLSLKDKIMFAQNLLNNYMTALSVTTDRLHCYLPCMAFKTPVNFIGNKNDPRMVSLIDGPLDQYKDVLLDNVSKWIDDVEKSRSD